MRIAFDLDGVLADLHRAYVQTALRLFPSLDRQAMSAADVGSSPPEELDETPAEGESSPETVAQAVPDSVTLSRSQSDAVWRALSDTADFWESLEEIETGTIARIAALADERRWEVLFITSRPRSAGRTVQRQSQRWLQEKGFPLPSLYVVHGSRGRIADALQLDVVIDDRPDNCLDVVLESKAGSILVWRGDQGKVPASARRLGIAVVPTVAQCLDALVEVERSRDGGGVLQRLRGLFGLRTRSAQQLLR